MLVNAGLPLNSKTNSYKKAPSSSGDPNSFKDVLAKNQDKKRPLDKVETKSVEKKKTPSLLNDEVAQPSEPVKAPVKNVNFESIENLEVATNQPLPVVGNLQSPIEGAAVVPLATPGVEMQRMSESIAGKNQNKGFSFSENVSANPESALSINSSELAKNTLASTPQKNAVLQNNLEAMLSKEAGAQKGMLTLENLPQETVVASAAAHSPTTAVGGAKAGGKIPLNPEMITKSSLDSSFSLEGLSPMEGKESVLAKGLADDSETDQSLESLFSQYIDQDLNVKESETAAFAKELEAAAAGEKPATVENMDSIVKQARTFIDEGGGSMEIHLQPEGLGKIHLKVAVQNGAVNVEMLADNAAAKRALEEGLIDIKSALEGQKLLVETLKVDMSQDYQKDFSDLRDQMQQHANRDFAEQFLGQFRQEREERLTGMFDGFRTFQKGPQDQELKFQQRNPYTQNGKGRTLNVVA